MSNAVVSHAYHVGTDLSLKGCHILKAGPPRSRWYPTDARPTGCSSSREHTATNQAFDYKPRWLCCGSGSRKLSILFNLLCIRLAVALLHPFDDSPNRQSAHQQWLGGSQPLCYQQLPGLCWHTPHRRIRPLLPPLFSLDRQINHLSAFSRPTAHVRS